MIRAPGRVYDLTEGRVLQSPLSARVGNGSQSGNFQRGAEEDAVLIDLICIGIYAALIGGVTFLEESVSRHLDALLLDALLRAGTFVLAWSALLAQFLFLRIAFPSRVTPMFGDLSFPSTVAGLGIGLLAGLASLCYCLALDHLRGSLVASAANCYIVVTVVLGIVLLHDSFTLVTAVGLLLTGAGIVALSSPHRPATSGASLTVKAIAAHMRGAGWIGGYVLLAGVSAFLEKPVLAHLAVTELNGLVALGMLVVGLAGLALRGKKAVSRSRHVRQSRAVVVGLGAIIGLAAIFYYLGLTHLPVSLAATLSNTYVIVPVVLAALVRRTSPSRHAATGVLMTLAGVTLLTLA